MKHLVSLHDVEGFVVQRSDRGADSGEVVEG